MLELPALPNRQAIRFPERERVLNWIRAIASEPLIMGSYWERQRLDGPLNSLPYPRENPIRRNIDGLVAWIRSCWDEIDGDRWVPILIDLLLSETHASQDQRVNPFAILDPLTGIELRVYPIRLDYLTGRERIPSWHNWPKDWPTPWSDSAPNQETES